MMRSDKQASLSPALLAGKKPGSSSDPVRAAASSGRALRIVPSASAESDDVLGAPPTAANAAPSETLLFSKGAASAAGFKPSYWSYERRGGVLPVDACEHETPSLPAPPARAAGDAAVLPRVARGSMPWGVLAFGCIALLLSGNVILGPPRHPAPVAPVSTPLPHPAAAHVAAPVSAGATMPMPATATAPSPQHRDALARSAEIAELLTRGNALLETGDITSARLYFERAAGAGDARAAFLLGQTFDPAYLRRAGAFDVRGDAALAATWYRRASALGEPAAGDRLKSLAK